jgi:hypothetical protein
VTSAPYSYAQSLVPLIITRLQPIADMGLIVAGMAEEIGQVGYDLSPDSVLIIPVAFSPMPGLGNAVRGHVTLTCTFNLRIGVRRQSTLYQVSDMVFQRLGGWEVTNGMVMNYNGSEFVLGADNDPRWITNMQWGVTYQAAPLRPS